MSPIKIGVAISAQNALLKNGSAAGLEPSMQSCAPSSSNDESVKVRSGDAVSLSASGTKIAALLGKGLQTRVPNPFADVCGHR